MNGHRTFLVLVISSVFAAGLFGQAGLSGDAFSGQTAEREGRDSKFDNGKMKSQSAIGQLEEMTGTQIERPSNQSSYTQTRSAPKPRPAAPRYNPELELKKQVAGALVDALFSSFLNDNAAQEQAQAEAAARAQAEEEQRRIQQEQARQARIQRAAHYRAEWDARDSEITDRLSGAFDFHPGTSFFGEPANPDADVVAALIGQPVADGATDLRPPLDIPEPGDAIAEPVETDPYADDPSVVDLRGSSGIVQPLRQTTGARSAKTPARSTPSRWSSNNWPDTESPLKKEKDPSELAALAGYFGPWLGKWYKEKVVEDTASAALWGVAQRKSQYFGDNMIVEYGKALFSFNSERNEMTKEVGDLYGEQTDDTFGKASSIARSLANPYSTGEDADSYFEELNHSGKKMTAKIYELVFDRTAGHFEMPDPHEIKTPSGEGNVVPVNDVPDPVSTHLPTSEIRNFLHY